SIDQSRRSHPKRLCCSSSKWPILPGGSDHQLWLQPQFIHLPLKGTQHVISSPVRSALPVWDRLEVSLRARDIKLIEHRIDTLAASVGPDLVVVGVQPFVCLSKIGASGMAIFVRDRENVRDAKLAAEHTEQFH